MESINKQVFFYIHIYCNNTCLKSLISERKTMKSAEDMTMDFTQSSHDRATRRSHLIICSQVN